VRQQHFDGTGARAITTPLLGLVIDKRFSPEVFELTSHWHTSKSNKPKQHTWPTGGKIPSAIGR
jgi:hypothetical protein